eukprot:3371175-Rhodomonas_salina.1
MLRMRACLGQPGKGDGRELCVRCMWLVATARLDFGSDELEQVLGSTLSAGPSTNTGAVTGEGAHTPKTRAGLFVPIAARRSGQGPSASRGCCALAPDCGGGKLNVVGEELGDAVLHLTCRTQHRLLHERCFVHCCSDKYLTQRAGVGKERAKPQKRKNPTLQAPQNEYSVIVHNTLRKKKSDDSPGNELAASQTPETKY